MVSDYGKFDSMEETMPISKFKATCLKVLGNVKKTGKRILITKKGEPIALVIPPPPPSKKKGWLGCMRGTVKIKGDIVSPVVEEEDWEVLNIETSP